MPERLRRLEYTFQHLRIYFVTRCTHKRQRILNNADVQARLIEFSRAGSDRGAWLGAYVLMPDHFHAFVMIDDARLSLPIWIKSLKNSLSKTLRALRVPSPHWQKVFFDHILRSHESYSAKWDYVRRNPIRARLVKEWSEWPFVGEMFDLEFRNDRV